jgi:hypothetical chaperone protein
VCGLDFGTSNSAIALATGEVLRLEHQARLSRSVLFFPEDTLDVLAGGTAIERYLEDNAGRFIQSMKTWLPSTTFTRTQIRQGFRPAPGLRTRSVELSSVVASHLVAKAATLS